MTVSNNVDKVPVAQIPERDLDQIKSLEEKLGNRYYLIAYTRD